MTKSKILMVGSNATRIDVQGGGTTATGQYFNETVVPAMMLLYAGYGVILATPNGSKPHIDPVSDSARHFGGDEAAYRRAKTFYAEHPSMNGGRTLRSVIDEGLDCYDAVFVPGGQAPVVDIMQNAETGKILRHFHRLGKPTAMLSHGPMATVATMPNAKAFRDALIAGETDRAVKLAEGWPYAGYKLTVISGTEQKVIEDNFIHAKLHFCMPDSLAIAGSEVTVTEIDFEPHVIIDRELITEQNPRSDRSLAEKLIAALGSAVA